jgi:hypothetical protein
MIASNGDGVAAEKKNKEEEKPKSRRPRGKFV